jgi:pimeloyl-ACP methyl ester carboxylesterase
MHPAMSRHQNAALIAAALLSTLAFGSSAAAQTFTTPPPSSSLVIGNMRFERYGQGDPALILLPGLSMGAWQWAGTIDAFSKDHAVYAATLAGFDGTPPAQPPYLAQADAAVITLVQQQGLKKPVMIGHSLGGHLALRLIEEHSDLFSGAVLVDTTPYFPPLQTGQTPAQRDANVAMLADGIRSAPDIFYEAQMRQTVATMVTSPVDIETVIEHALRSDRTTLAGTTSEMSEDLRPALSRIAVPTLVVAPVSHEAPYMTDALRALTPQQLDDTIRNYYASQFPGAKTVTVQTIDGSKHFVMLDQPDALNAAISSFLSSLRHT